MARLKKKKKKTPRIKILITHSPRTKELNYNIQSILDSPISTNFPFSLKKKTKKWHGSMISEIYIHPTSSSPHEKKKKEINRRSIRNRRQPSSNYFSWRNPLDPRIQWSHLPHRYRELHGTFGPGHLHFPLGTRGLMPRLKMFAGRPREKRSQQRVKWWN